PRFASASPLFPRHSTATLAGTPEIPGFEPCGRHYAADDSGALPVGGKLPQPCQLCTGQRHAKLKRLAALTVSAVARQALLPGALHGPHQRLCAPREVTARPS